MGQYDFLFVGGNEISIIIKKSNPHRLEILDAFINLTNLQNTDK